MPNQSRSKGWEQPTLGLQLTDIGWEQTEMFSAKPAAGLGTHVIQYPSGRWGIAGHVPAALAYVTKDGGEPTAEQLEKARSFGPRLAGVRERTWDTEAEARAALAAHQN